MLPMFRRLFCSSPVDDGDASKNAAVAETHSDRRAFHESVFKGGQLPPGASQPRQKTMRIDGYGHSSENIVTNVFVPILAAPGVGVRSFVNKARYGDMKCTILEADFPIAPPQFLCDGNVYALGLAKLPLPHLLKSGFAVDSGRMAVVLAFAVDDLQSFEEVKELYRRLAQSFKLKLPGKSPMPFPALLLGMRVDMSPSRGSGGDERGGYCAQQAPTTERQETIETTHKERIQAKTTDQNPQASAKRFAELNGLLYGECSAKTGDGIIESMCRLVEEIEAMVKTDQDPELSLENLRDSWIPTVAKIIEPRQATSLAIPEPTARA